MADTYGVTPDDVAAQLPGLLPNGFSPASKPIDATVRSLISTADTIVSLAVRAATSVAPATSDQAAALARQYVITEVLAGVMLALYAGQQPGVADGEAKPYRDAADRLLAAIHALGAQAAGDGTATSRVRSSAQASDASCRRPLIRDHELGEGARRSRRF